jgi:hypothetical protein
MLESITLSPAHVAQLQTLANVLDLDLESALQLVFSDWSLENEAADAIDEEVEIEEDEGIEFSLDGTLDLLEEWLGDEQLTADELSWAFATAIETYTP